MNFRFCKIFFCVIFFIFSSFCRSQSVNSELNISDFKFESIFGFHIKDTNSVYCILGTGFFKTKRAKNSDNLLLIWIKSHPNAKVIPISSFGPVETKIKDSKMIYCWIIENKDTLNTYLVSNGCYPGGTMIKPKTWNEMEKWEKELYEGSNEKPNVEVLVEKKIYDGFIKQIKVAEEYATKNKLGIWAKELEE